MLPALTSEFASSVDMIYIDPPFATGADFSLPTLVPDSGDEFTKKPTVIEQKAYRDTWGKSWDSYVGWFSDTVTLRGRGWPAGGCPRRQSPVDLGHTYPTRQHRSGRA